MRISRRADGSRSRNVITQVVTNSTEPLESCTLGFSQQSCHQGPFGLRSSRVSISSSKRPYGLTCSQISGVTARRSVGVNRPAQCGLASTCCIIKVLVRVNRRRIASVSAVPSRSAVVYLIINDFVFFARRGELVSNRTEDHELSMLALHLLQNCMVYINTLMMQQVLARPHWAGRLTPTDLRAVTPLIWEHVNPYGRFELDMETRLDLSPNGPW